MHTCCESRAAPKTCDIPGVPVYVDYTSMHWIAHSCYRLFCVCNMHVTCTNILLGTGFRGRGGVIPSTLLYHEVTDPQDLRQHKRQRLHWNARIRTNQVQVSFITLLS